jgi:hypothetical protein
MDPTMIQHLARARLADLHDQARRDALVRAARRSRRAQNQHSGRGRSRLVAVITARAWLARPAYRCGLPCR